MLAVSKKVGGPANTFLTMTQQQFARRRSTSTRSRSPAPADSEWGGLDRGRPTPTFRLAAQHLTSPSNDRLHHPPARERGDRRRSASRRSRSRCCTTSRRRPAYACSAAKAIAVGDRRPGTSSTATTARRSSSSSATWATSLHLNFGYSLQARPERRRAVQGERRPQRLPVRRRAGAVAADRDPARDRPGGQAQQSRRLPRDRAELHALLDAVVLPRHDPDPVLRARLRHLPGRSQRSITTTWQAITHPEQLTLPIVTLTLINVASFSRYMRSSALDNLAQDYIRLGARQGPVRAGGAASATCCATPACR